jgi:RNA polymerase sigma-70 factor (ECF subfamily)
MGQELNLICEIKKENRLAFKYVYDQYSDKLYYLSLRFNLNKEEAKEIVQEVFLTLWEKRGGLKEELSLNSYLLTITKNKILNLQKKKVSELARDQKYYLSHDASSSSTEDHLIYSDLEKCTKSFIESLPARNKQIFLLSKKDELSNEEISILLNISRRTVENNIYQAEKAIRQFLHENQYVVKSFAFLLVLLRL